MIKLLAKELGAGAVGITRVTQDALYKGGKIEYKNAIVILYPMDHDEMRYVTQAFEIAVELDEADATAPSVEKLRASFHSAHEKLFEFAGDLDQPCEIVSIRVGGSVPPSDVPYPSSSVVSTSRAFDQAQIFEGGREVIATVIPRANLEGIVHGPVIMEDETSTIYVPEQWQCWHDHAHNLVIESVHG